MSSNNSIIFHMQVERIKRLSGKVLYCFVIFTVNNERLIKNDRPIRANVSEKTQPAVLQLLRHVIQRYIQFM